MGINECQNSFHWDILRIGDILGDPERPELLLVRSYERYDGRKEQNCPKLASTGIIFLGFSKHCQFFCLIGISAVFDLGKSGFDLLL